MERRRAFAYAGATTIAALAAVIAIGANLGLFGLTRQASGAGRLTPVATTPVQPASAVTVYVDAPPASPTTATTSTAQVAAAPAGPATAAPPAAPAVTSASAAPPAPPAHEQEHDDGGHTSSPAATEGARADD